LLPPFVSLFSLHQSYNSLALWHHPGRSSFGQTSQDERQRRLQVFEILAACLETLLDKDARKRCDSLLREQQQVQQEQSQEEPQTVLPPTPACTKEYMEKLQAEQEQVLNNKRDDNDRDDNVQPNHGELSNTSLAQSSQSRGIRGRSSSRSQSTGHCAHSGTTRSTRTVMLLRDDSIDTIRCSSGSASGNRRRSKNRRRAGKRLQLVGRIAVKNDVDIQAVPEMATASFDGDEVLAARASNEQPCRPSECQINGNGYTNDGASKSSLLGEGSGQNSGNDAQIADDENEAANGSIATPNGFNFFFRCGQQPPSFEQDIPEMDASSSSNDDSGQNRLDEYDSFDSSQNTDGTRTRLREIHYTENETNRLFGGPLKLMFRARRWKPFTDPYSVFAQVFGTKVSLGEGIGAIPDPLPRGLACIGDSQAESNSSAMTDQIVTSTTATLTEPIWNLPLLVPAVSSSVSAATNTGMNKKMKRRRRNKRNRAGGDDQSSSEILPNGTTCITTTRIFRDRRLTRTEVVRLDPETGQRCSNVTVTSELIANGQASDCNNNNKNPNNSRSERGILSRRRQKTPGQEESQNITNSNSAMDSPQQILWFPFDDCGSSSIDDACNNLCALPTKADCSDCSSNSNNFLCGLQLMFRK
jgi:hypothetical protein